MIDGRWDRALRTFHAAAEGGSFTAAARALGVGQPAVSHAVRKLEEHLGARLFDRTRDGVGLTSHGQALYDELDGPLRRIDAALARTREAAAGATTVSLSVSTSLATYWLLPRLPRFKQDHPETDLRVITADEDRPTDADLWIPLGSGPWPEGRSWHFADEELFPVAAPALAAGLTGDPCALVAAPLLHLEERYSPRFDWRSWFDHLGCPVDGDLPGARSNDYSLIVHAALEGQGVAIGWRHIVQPLLDAGRLERIGTASVRTERPFRVVASSAEPAAAARALRDWLIGEASSSEPT